MTVVEGIEDGCSAQLTCSRVKAEPGQKCDLEGIVGCVCPHTIPGRDLFVNMTTAEQMGYYDICFGRLVVLRPDLRTIYQVMRLHPEVNILLYIILPRDVDCLLSFFSLAFFALRTSVADIAHGGSVSWRQVALMRGGNWSTS